MTASPTSPLILIADDQASIRELSSEALSPAFRIVEAADGQEALRQAYANKPDLVLLDIRMPVLDGLHVLRRLRELSNVPVILVTANGADHDIALGLDSGAQDYIVKPFSPVQLAARVRATLRDHQVTPSAATEVLTFDEGRLALDTGTRCAHVRGREVVLTATEYRILEMLCRNPRRVLSADQILRHAWGPEYVGEPGYVKTYMGLLRIKLEADPHRPVYLRSRRGLGYFLDPQGQPAEHVA